MDTLHRFLGTLLACVFLAIVGRPARAQVLLPDQFVDQLVATGLNTINDESQRWAIPFTVGVRFQF
jgi:hypothetical protein